ncbi:efflux RND transporter periplasmic adaptor subunit [Gilvimarinus algae]|uniref:Efflux RND transporter periplasmic adaptor subunit n=1 Tax=Gilvimarinus algae TaxID=3058037 RepID=A0ABT8THZ6_9GAMM|nr:efflux RND transporter periplasmic adaptor subunit [Gilvimarinus sp. SDUM040014]MDO3382973.1 efflux RND transporter periplasmic adaptor subunit [Gilvimarinus sp. SDUM040014]
MKLMSGVAPRGLSLLSKPAYTALILVLLGACSERGAEAPAAPPPAVSVYSVVDRPVGSYREFVGRTEAHRTVDLKARVEGELVQRGFVEGTLVSEGQLLFAIEDAPYRAAVQAAEADLERARSEVERTAKEYERGQQLAPDGYLSEQDLDKLKAAASQAKSALKAAESQLETARINLGYTRILAPFTGVIGKTRYNVGTIVGPASEPLAELSASDPIYVNFQLEESTYISYLQRRQREGVADQAPPVDIAMRLPNNDTYPQQGVLNFADTRVDATMGSVSLRAEFPNPDGVVVPGLYVTLLVEGREKDTKAVIPQAAVQSGQDGYSVLVVDSNNTVQQRLVSMGRRMGPMWIVEAGLEAGERIIIDGLQKVRAGIEVAAKEREVDPVTGAIAPLDSQ